MARSTPFDTQRLTRFFGSGRAFYRSPMGGMIEHLRARSRDSADQPIPRSPPWSYLPQPDAAHGVKGLRGIMFVNETPSSTAGSYEIDEGQMATMGEMDRRLRNVLRHSPLAYQVLAAYHGDRGSLWATAAIDRKIEPTNGGTAELIRGVGPGALAALYTMTEAGRSLLALERALSTRPAFTKATEKRHADAIAAHAAYREELQAAIAAKRAELAATGETGSEQDLVAMRLGALRAEEIDIKDGGAKVPSRLRTARVKAEADLETVREAQKEIRRTLHQLQEQLAYTAGAPAAPNPKPDDGAAEIMRARRLAESAYELELKVWRETKENLERVCGPMADTDPRLGSRPAPPDLPPVPQVLLVVATGRKVEPLPELSDDALLKTAFLLSTTTGRGTSDQNRKNVTRRALLLQRAGAQATLLLQRAWVEWEAAGHDRTPPIVYVAPSTPSTPSEIP